MFFHSKDGTGDGTPRFVRDTSKYWYKSRISREEGTRLIYTSRL